MQCFSTYFSWRNVLYCANTIAHYKSKIRRKCMGNLRKKSVFFKLNLQCFSAYLDLRNVWCCAFVVARYKTKKFQNWKKKYIIITLCLTSQAIDSPVLTKLFTWGRHRNMLQKQHVSDIGPLPQFKWLKANGYSPRIIQILWLFIGKKQRNPMGMC